MKRRALSLVFTLTLFLNLSVPAWAAGFELPVYKDYVFYGARSGDVLELEDRSNLLGEHTYVIQSSVNGKAVTALSEDLLWGMGTGAVTLVIPDTVTEIPDLGQEEGQTITFVCNDDAPAAQYAAENGIEQLTPEENQRRADAKTFSNKNITVLVNHAGPDKETNDFRAAGSDVTVTLQEYEGAATTVQLDKAGSATVKGSNAATLTISRPGSNTVTADFKTLTSADGGTTFYLESEGDHVTFQNVWVLYTEEDGSQTAYDVYHNSYVLDRAATAPTTFRAEVDWGGHGAGSIQLWQSGSTATFSGDTLSCVLKDKFDTTADLFLLATAADGTQVKKKLDVQATDLALEGLTVDITHGLKITLPKSLPFIGGSDLSLDIGKFPLDVCIEDGKIYAIIGFDLASYEYKDKELGNGRPGRPAKVKTLYFDLKNDLSKVAEGASDLKQLFTKDTFRNYRLRTHASMSVTGDAELMGYFEGTIRPDGSIFWGDAQIIVQAGGKVQFGGQFQAGPVPMYWEVYLKGDAEGKLSVAKIAYTIVGSDPVPFLPYGSLEASVALGGGIGVGANSLASVGGGVEGSATAGLNFKTDLIHYRVGGKFSIYAKACLAFFEWSKTWDVAQGTWVEGNWDYPSLQLLDNGDSVTVALDLLAPVNDPSSYRVQDQSYLNEEGRFAANDLALQTSGEPVLFQENVYQLPQSQLARLDSGTQILVWLGGASDRESPNKTALYYSFQPQGGDWSVPVLVDDDGTADFQPVLAADGDRAWLVWQNADRMFDASAATADVAASLELVGAYFNGSAFEGVQALTDNGVYDYAPALAAGDGIARVYWLQDPSNDLTGNGTEASILYADWTASGWGEPVLCHSADGTILKALAAGYDGGFQYAHIADMDGDSATSGDLELFFNGTRQTYDNVLDAAPRFSGGQLYWYRDGIVVDQAGTSLLPSGVGLDTEDFQVYTDPAGRMAVVYPVTNGAYAELYGVFRDGSTISQPIPLTGTGHHVQAGLGFYTAEGLVLPCAVTQVTGALAGTAEGAENAPLPLGQTDLNLLDYREESALSISQITYDDTRLVGGNNFTVYASVHNTGARPAAAFDVVLWDDDGHMPVSGGLDFNPKAADCRVTTPLAGGDTVEVALTFQLPEDFAGNYTITVTPVDDLSAEYDDDAVKAGAVCREAVTLSAFADLSVRAELLTGTEGTPVVKAVVGSAGIDHPALPVTLYAVDDEENATLLATQAIQVTSGEQTVVAFPLTGLSAQRYRIEVPEQPGENNAANNSDFCVPVSNIPLELGAISRVDGDSLMVQVLAAPQTDALLVVASYDMSGRLLSSQNVELAAGLNTAEYMLPGAGATQVRCFLLEPQTLRPLCAAQTRDLAE